MALLTKKEFATNCGMTTRELAVYIKRGKVVVNAEAMIDDTDLQNKDFTGKHKDKKNGVAVSGPKTEKKEKAKPPEKPEVNHERSNTLYELEKETKSIELDRRKKDSEVLAIKLSKMRGEVIPTDLVRLLFAQHFKSVTINFKQGIESLLTEIGKKMKMNTNQIAELRGSMVKVINDSVNQSVSESARHVDNLVSEYRKIEKA